LPAPSDNLIPPQPSEKDPPGEDDNAIPSFSLIPVPTDHSKTADISLFLKRPDPFQVLIVYRVRALYLKEEIQNEALTRKVAQFLEFLDLMALTNGEEISYQSLARDCGVSANSIKNYVEILEDTLVAFRLRAFTKTRKRKAISRSKLYFFDVGVTNSLANRGEILAGSELFGKAFQHFILLEVRAFLSYARKRERMSYWRSTSGFEVERQ